MYICIDMYVCIYIYMFIKILFPRRFLKCGKKTHQKKNSWPLVCCYSNYRSVMSQRPRQKIGCAEISGVFTHFAWKFSIEHWVYLKWFLDEWIWITHWSKPNSWHEIFLGEWNFPTPKLPYPHLKSNEVIPKRVSSLKPEIHVPRPIIFSIYSVNFGDVPSPPKKILTWQWNIHHLQNVFPVDEWVFVSL